MYRPETEKISKRNQWVPMMRVDILISYNNIARNILANLKIMTQNEVTFRCIFNMIKQPERFK